MECLREWPSSVMVLADQAANLSSALAPEFDKRASLTAVIQVAGPRIAGISAGLSIDYGYRTSSAALLLPLLNFLATEKRVSRASYRSAQT